MAVVVCLQPTREMPFSIENAILLMGATLELDTFTTARTGLGALWH